MTGDVVNLRRARKDRQRAEDKARADENAARHGLTKAERLRQAAQTDKAARMLDQHKRDED